MKYFSILDDLFNLDYIYNEFIHVKILPMNFSGIKLITTEIWKSFIRII